MSTHLKLIGLTGRKRCGKGTVAAMLPNYRCLSFAAPIKRMLMAVGVTPAEIEDKETILPRFGASPRFMMQTLGTEWGRDIVSPQLWTGLAYREANPILKIGLGVVFDDLRFDNEAQLVKDMGGVIWCIERPNLASDSHVSERGIDPKFIDHRLANFGTVAMLRETVTSLLSSQERALLS